MQAVILAAGRGTRMGPLTETMPKPMLPVADRPLVGHVADAAVAAGTEELVITIGFGGDSVRDHFGTSYAGVPIRYAEQPTQRGTADALAAAADLIDGDFAVLNGDSLYQPADLERLFDGAPQIGAHRVDTPSDYGVLVTDDGVVTEVNEKPPDPKSNLVNAGAYAFPEEVVELLDVDESERGELELTDVLDRLVARGELETVVFDEWLDVGRPWELLEANERRLPGLAVTVDSKGDPTAAPVDGATDDGLTSDETTADGGVTATASRFDLTAPVDAKTKTDGDARDGNNPAHAADAKQAHDSVEGDDTDRDVLETAASIHPDATIRGHVVVEDGATIDAGVVIEGPVRVRSGASVGPNSYVRGATLIGEDVYVGHAVEIKNSVLLADTNVGHLSYVGDSVLGQDVNLGAGTNVANLRHDGDPVRMMVKGDRVSTGRRKFGAVLGPGVKTGIQTGINAGVTLSAGTRVAPGEIVLRDR